MGKLKQNKKAGKPDNQIAHLFFTSGKIDWPRHIDPVAKDLIKKFLVQVILIAIVILIIKILTISIAIANPIINSLLLLNIDYHHI